MLLIPILAACALLAACGPTVEVVVSDYPQPAPVNRLVVGTTHTQYTVGTVSPSTPRTVELDVLRQIPVHNQHLMGWGVGNPEPSPGVYNWSSLDARINMIQSTGAEPVLTLCCAPDWMKGGQAGQTNWGILEVAPLPEHVADFAALAAAAAVRYPQVKRFQVWNEMKGFYDPATNNWDAAAYTRLYNAVYDAVKAARPDAKVGGPYAPLDLWSSPAAASHPSNVTGPWGVIDKRPLDLLEYWLANKHGADFVSLDGWTKTRDSGFITDPYTATDVYLTMSQWLRARTDLPIWWSEFHVVDPSWSLEKQDAVTTMAISKLADGGASLAFLWSPQPEPTGCVGCLWSDPASGPVTPTPLSRTVAAWNRRAPAGTYLRNEQPSSGSVFAAATAWGTFVVNRTSGHLNVKIGGTSIPLGVDGVGVISSDPSCYR